MGVEVKVPEERDDMVGVSIFVPISSLAEVRNKSE